MLHQPLTEQETNAILRICVLAAFADGGQSEAERTQIEQIISGFPGPHLNSASAYQDVLTGKLSLRQISGELQEPSAKSLAYEMAACVCHADGMLQDSEKQFLTELRQALQLDSQVAENHQAAAQQLATAPLTAAAPPVINTGREAEVDHLILNNAILAGALEMMPHALATMAILPVQMRMVYQIGKRYGYELDRGHIKDFLATIGIGLTSQAFEGCARRLVGVFTRRVAGGLLGGLVGEASGMALAFATTYSLGKVSEQYYSSGRTLSTAQLKQVFSSMLGEAQ